MTTGICSRFARCVLHMALWGCLCTSGCFAGQALAAQPAPTAVQAPGFYRIKLGNFQVTVLLDGARTLSAKAALRNIGEPEIDALLARGAETDEVMTSFNAFLVDTGAERVLVDAGAGGMFGAGLGHLSDNLQAAGYRAEQIDRILLTHLHVDHVGGLVTADGRRAFPNATVYANRADAQHWLSAKKREAAVGPLQAFFNNARDALRPYEEANRLVLFDSEAELLPGIGTVALPGHSPGHTGYLVSSRGRQLMLWGDLVHLGAVQFARPITGFRADSDGPGAADVRQRVFEQAAGTGALIGGAHISFPGVGHLRKDGGGFRWLPLGYDAVP